LSNLDLSGKVSYRSNNTVGFLICALLLAAASLYIDPLSPLSDCALCTLVRTLLVAMAGIFVLGFLLNGSKLIQRFLSAINIVLCLTGIVTVVRHLISVKTDDLPESCSMSLMQMIDQLTPQQAIFNTLNNAVYCPGSDWKLFNIGFAELSIAAFIILLAVVWKLMTKKTKRKLTFR